MNSMLSIYNKPQFLSRIFTDVRGRQFRLTFLVAVVNGEVRGRLVSATPISASDIGPMLALGGQTLENTPFCLPIICNENKPATEYIPAFAPVVSPYYSLDFLINSQPTRAPSRI